MIRPWDSARWDLVTKHLTEAEYFVPAVMSPKKLDRMVDLLYSHINAALDCGVRLRPKSSPKPKTHWMTDDLVA